METFYGIIFLVSALAAGGVEWSKKSEGSSGATDFEFLKFRNNYVLVYALMMGEFVYIALPMCIGYVPHTSTVFSQLHAPWNQVPCMTQHTLTLLIVAWNISTMHCYTACTAMSTAVLAPAT